MGAQDHGFIVDEGESDVREFLLVTVLVDRMNFGYDWEFDPTEPWWIGRSTSARSHSEMRIAQSLNLI
jgi:hypothetical protein